MDVHIIYFDETTNRVKKVYLNFQFMVHATVSDMMENFKKAHNGLDIISNLVQLSMDGPNVNWAFLEGQEKYRKLENPKVPSLIVLGSGGLHIVHGIYKTGQQQINWDLEKNMKAAHGIFKKSTARKSDYLAANDIEMTDDDSSVSEHFPLKFCGHRWL